MSKLDRQGQMGKMREAYEVIDGGKVNNPCYGQDESLKREKNNFALLFGYVILSINLIKLVWPIHSFYRVPDFHLSLPFLTPVAGMEGPMQRDYPTFHGIYV